MRTWFSIIAAGVFSLLCAAAATDVQGATLRWTKTYNGADNGADYGYGVAVAADGSVYVTGVTEVAGQVTNLLLLKYK